MPEAGPELIGCDGKTLAAKWTLNSATVVWSYLFWWVFIKEERYRFLKRANPCTVLTSLVVSSRPETSAVEPLAITPCTWLSNERVMVVGVIEKVGCKATNIELANEPTGRLLDKLCGLHE
jgi:hypothetical protein